MSNLIRNKTDILINTLSPAEFGMYYEGQVNTGTKHLVIKKIGADLVAGSTSVKILIGNVGQKLKRTLTIAYLWNGEATKTFSVVVQKQPTFNGFSNDATVQAPHVHSYTHTFATSTVGTLTNADKDAIINGLIAAIEADVQLGISNTQTGAIVVGTLTVAHTLELEAKDYGVFFTCDTTDGDFTQAQTVAYKKPTLTNDDVARIFSVKMEDAGTRPELPILGETYCKIQITKLTDGYDNTSASAYNTREQIFNIYCPLNQVDSDVLQAIAVPTGSPLAVPSMEDVAASPSVSLGAYLKLIDTAMTDVYDIATSSDGTEAADIGGTYDFGATITTTPSGGTVTYATSDATLATVSTAGVVTGVAAGDVTITATCEGLSVSTVVTVS